LKLCHDLNQKNVAKIGTNDNVKNHLLHAVKIIEKQQRLIANERVHYQKELKRLQEVIDKLTKGVTKELSDQLDGFTGKLTLTVNISNHSLVFISAPHFINDNLGAMFAFPHASIVVIYYIDILIR
jgi:hypothetical protein